MNVLQDCLDAFRRCQSDRPADHKSLKDALQALPEVGRLPSPWATWTLIELVLHDRRQRWARDMLIDRLGPPEGWLDEGIAMKGFVSGSPEWEMIVETDLEFFTLNNRVTGELITVPFATGACGGGFFFAGDLIESWNRCPPRAGDSRLVRLHPSNYALHESIEHLKELDIVEEEIIEEDIPVERLSEAVILHSHLIEDFVDAWDCVGLKVWLAAVIGDWITASSLILPSWDAELIAMSQARSSQCRRRRRAWLSGRLKKQYSASTHAALHDLGVRVPSRYYPLSGLVE